MEIKFEIIKAPIAEINASGFRREAQHALEEHMKKVQEDVSKYPPPQPTYVRTNVLFTSWHRETVTSGDEISVIVYNDAQDKYGRLYSSLVHGDFAGLGQRALHAGHGWLNLARTHQARRAQLIDTVSAAIDKFVRATFKV